MNHIKTPFYPDHVYSNESPDMVPLYESKEAYTAAQDQLNKELTEQFPLLFGRDSRPWAVGIREELIDIYTAKGYPQELVAQTLHFEARSVNYRVNCMLAGVNADRVGICGKPQGKLSRRDFIYNLMQLSGLVRRKDAKQSWSYHEWALRETVLGLIHGDFTREDLISAKLKVKFVDLCVKFSKDEQAIKALILRNKRTGELHPSVYGAPYIPDELFNAFKKRNDGHVTAGKKKPRRIQLVSRSHTLFSLEEGKAKAPATNKNNPVKKTNKNNGNKAGARRRLAPNTRDSFRPRNLDNSEAPIKPTKTVEVRVKPKKRIFTQGHGA